MKRTKKQLMKIAENHLKQTHNILFSQESECTKDHQQNFSKHMMVEFYLKLTELNHKSNNRK